MIEFFVFHCDSRKGNFLENIVIFANNGAPSRGPKRQKTFLWFQAQMGQNGKGSPLDGPGHIFWPN